MESLKLRVEISQVFSTLLNGVQNKSVLIIGDVMLDGEIKGPVFRTAPDSLSTPVIDIHTTCEVPGGAGNVAMNCRGFGLSVNLIGVTGIDSAEKRLSELLTENNIGQKGLIKISGRPTTSKTRIVGNNMQLVRLDCEDCTPLDDEMTSELLCRLDDILLTERPNVIILSEYGKGVLTEGFCQSIIKRAKCDQIPILVDPKGCNFAKYRGSDFLFPNRRELLNAVMVEHKNPQNFQIAARNLFNELHLEALIVKLGEEGCLLVKSEDSKIFPVEAKDTVNTSGAGDTFISTFAAGRIMGWSLEDCVTLSNLAASHVVGEPSVIPRALVSSSFWFQDVKDAI